MSLGSTVESLVVTLGAVGPADIVSIGRLYDEELIALGHDPRAWITHVQVSNLTITDGVVTLPATGGEGGMIKLITMFYDDRELVRENELSLRAFDDNWRDKVGDPIAFTPETEDDRKVRLYPKPFFQATGSTLTTNDHGIGLIFTKSTDLFVPDYLVMPLALRIVAREYERESDHRDMDFATVARALAEHFLNLVS